MHETTAMNSYNSPNLCDHLFNPERDYRMESEHQQGNVIRYGHKSSGQSRFASSNKNSILFVNSLNEKVSHFVVDIFILLFFEISYRSFTFPLDPYNDIQKMYSSRIN